MNDDLMSTLKWKELAEVEAYLDLRGYKDDVTVYSPNGY